MVHRMPHAACILAGLFLFVPATLAQQQTNSSLLDVDATASEVHIEIDITGHLQLSGVRTERVRVEATSSGDLAACPITLQQNGDTVEIRMVPSEACTSDVDLQVDVPRRFDATIVAPKAPEVGVRDLGGRVTGAVSPELECHFRSFRGSSSCEKGHFDLAFSRGEFVMRARSKE